jgi:hypothetical protein
MRTWLLLPFALFLSACAVTPPDSSPAEIEPSGATAETPVDATGGNPEKGRRAALWTGIGFALYAIYEANDDDDEPAAPQPATGCLSLKCW